MSITNIFGCVKVLTVPAHDDDVNTVAYAEQDQPHVLYSGSDDGLINVWDRRCLGKPSGTLIGHTEGVTFVDSKHDGRYLISNGKDQVCCS